MSARVVVWDLGEVLVPSWDLTTLSAPLGVDAQRFAEAYWAHRVAYDCGDSAATYWAAVGHDTGIAVDEATSLRLAQQDAASWSVLPAHSLALLTELRAVGAAQALLSNAPHALAVAVRACTWSSLFDELVFSAEVGVSKPQPAIYDHVSAALSRLRPGTGEALAPSDIVFFDDRVANVEGALAAGWQAHVWPGIEPARVILGQAGLLPST